MGAIFKPKDISKKFKKKISDESIKDMSPDAINSAREKEKGTD
ncbi:MAG: hypothetical protein ACTHKJ_05635 [Candidatus Nitrosocosmicus sp.]